MQTQLGQLPVAHPDGQIEIDCRCHEHGEAISPDIPAAEVDATEIDATTLTRSRHRSLAKLASTLFLSHAIRLLPIRVSTIFRTCNRN